MKYHNRISCIQSEYKDKLKAEMINIEHNNALVTKVKKSCNVNKIYIHHRTEI